MSRHAMYGSTWRVVAGVGAVVTFVVVLVVRIAVFPHDPAPFNVEAACKANAEWRRTHWHDILDHRKTAAEDFKRNGQIDGVPNPPLCQPVTPFDQP